MKNWKRVFCGVLAGMMIAAMPVQAAQLDVEVKATIETNDIPPWPKASDIMAQTGLLMEYSTGTVIYSKGSEERVDPSGLTKLMTLLVALENSSLTDQVTFNETGLAFASQDGTGLGLQNGEILSMKQCLNAMILDSSNEAAAQVAAQIAGSEAAFVEKMNAKAKKLGCENTNFTNATGIADPNQYTTAEDMAMIFRAGFKNKEFRRIVRTPKFVLKPTNLNGMSRTLTSCHPILSKHSSIMDPDCQGGHQGMSADVGCNLVTAVKKNGVTYISVVMKDVDINQAGADSQYLLKYGYENFQRIAVEGGSVVIPNGTSVADLRISEKKSGNKIRTFYTMADHRVGRGEKAGAAEAPVVQDPSAQAEGDVVEAQSEGEVKNQTPVEEAKENGLSDTAKILLRVMAGMAIVLLILCILLAIKDFKDARRYREEEDEEE